VPTRGEWKSLKLRAELTGDLDARNKALEAELGRAEAQIEAYENGELHELVKQLSSSTSATSPTEHTTGLEKQNSVLRAKLEVRSRYRDNEDQTQLLEELARVKADAARLSNERDFAQTQIGNLQQELAAAKEHSQRLEEQLTPLAR
jgi:dynactin complex subunit